MPWLTGSKLGFGVQPSGGASEPMQISGGTKTTHGSYTVHTFTSPGTLTITGGTGAPLPSVAFLLVGGGGGGGMGNANEGGGGGGAGGAVKHGGYTILGPTGGPFAVEVGYGGNGGNQPNSPSPAGDPASAHQLLEIMVGIAHFMPVLLYSSVPKVVVVDLS